MTVEAFRTRQGLTTDNQKLLVFLLIWGHWWKHASDPWHENLLVGCSMMLPGASFKCWVDGFWSQLSSHHHPLSRSQDGHGGSTVALCASSSGQGMECARGRLTSAAVHRCWLCMVMRLYGYYNGITDYSLPILSVTGRYQCVDCCCLLLDVGVDGVIVAVAAVVVGVCVCVLINFSGLPTSTVCRECVNIGCSTYWRSYQKWLTE